MDEMYEIDQKAKCRFLGTDQMEKTGDEWNI